MAQKDNFPGGGANAQARSFEVITPHATNDLLNRYKAIYVGQGGDIVVVGDEGGAGVLLKGVPTGALLLISPVKILAIGTTATNLVGWY